MASFFLRSFLSIALLAFWQLAIVFLVTDVIDPTVCGDWKRGAKSCLGPYDELVSILNGVSLTGAMSAVLSLGLAGLVLLILPFSAHRKWKRLKLKLGTQELETANKRVNWFNIVLVWLLLTSLTFYGSAWLLIKTNNIAALGFHNVLAASIWYHFNFFVLNIGLPLALAVFAITQQFSRGLEVKS